MKSSRLSALQSDRETAPGTAVLGDWGQPQCARRPPCPPPPSPRCPAGVCVAGALPVPLLELPGAQSVAISVKRRI